MSEPRICIVGAGILASRRIYPYIGAVGGAIVGACDLELGKAEQNARRFGGRPYSDLHAMLRAERPDGVIICIGPEAHAKLAPEVLRLGFPVYTEKPPAPTAEEAYNVVRASRETGIACATGFKKRYAKPYQRAAEWLAKFDESQRMSISLDYASGRYSNRDSGSSLLLDFGIHALDLLGFLFGDVKTVFAFQQNAHAYAVSILFRSGAVGNLNLTDGRSFTVPTEELEITLRGGNFMSIHNSSSWRITEGQQPVEWHEPPTFTSAGDSGEYTGHLAELAAFVETLRAPKRLRSDIYESYKSMVLFEAIQASAGASKAVDVTYQE